MNNISRQWELYTSKSGRVSSIMRCVVLGLGAISLFQTLTISSLVVIYISLDVLQYLYLSEVFKKRAKLLEKGISIEKLESRYLLHLKIANIVYYGKIITFFILLYGLFVIRILYL